MSDNSYDRKGFFGEFFKHFRHGLATHLDRKLGKVLDAPIRPPGALDEVEFLSASTAENADLPLFLAVSNEVAPLSGLNFIIRGGGDEDEMQMMIDKVDHFDAAQFLAFAPLDEATTPALERLRPRQPALAADFQIIAQSYDELIAQVGKLKDEWEFLQANSHILVLQIIALCLVSFAAPFRLGKSIIELRRKV